MRVTARGGDALFDQWVREISHNPDAPPDDPGVISAGWQRWLRRVFETQGPVAKDVVTRAARIADRLILAIGLHPGKAPLFTADERIAMLGVNAGTLLGIAAD